MAEAHAFEVVQSGVAFQQHVAQRQRNGHRMSLRVRGGVTGRLAVCATCSVAELPARSAESVLMTRSALPSAVTGANGMSFMNTDITGGV
jgi:hypothetical protein